MADEPVRRAGAPADPRKHTGYRGGRGGRGGRGRYADEGEGASYTPFRPVRAVAVDLFPHTVRRALCACILVRHRVPSFRLSLKPT